MSVYDEIRAEREELRKWRKRKRLSQDTVATFHDKDGNVKRKLTAKQLIKQYNAAIDELGQWRLRYSQIAEYLREMKLELDELREGLLDTDTLLSDFPGECDDEVETWILTLRDDITDVIDKVLDPLVTTADDERAAEEEEMREKMVKTIEAMNAAETQDRQAAPEHDPPATDGAEGDSVGGS